MTHTPQTSTRACGCVIHHTGDVITRRDRCPEHKQWKVVVEEVVHHVRYKYFDAPTAARARLDAESEAWDRDNGWREDTEALTECEVRSVLEETDGK